MHRNALSFVYVRIKFFGVLEALVFLVVPTVLCRKVLLACTAQRAYPIGGQILKIGVLVNAVLGVTQRGIVLVPAKLTYLNQHSLFSFFSRIIYIVCSNIIYHCAPFVNILFAYSFFYTNLFFSIFCIDFANLWDQSVLFAAFCHFL